MNFFCILGYNLLDLFLTIRISRFPGVVALIELFSLVVFAILN